MFILILGLGRTGGYLASKLVAHGHQVIGTSRAPSPKNLPGIKMVHWQSENGTMDLPDADCVICAFPPSPTYPLQIAALRLRYHDKQIIQISSTGVFAKNQGTVHEYTRPTPDDKMGILLLEAEDIILQHPFGRLIRAAGLYDDHGHPVEFLARQTSVDDPTGPINLVHRHDVADIIFDMISGKIEQRIVHAVHPEHPPRQEYYLEKARELGVATPSFRASEVRYNRIVATSLQRSWRPL